MADLDTNGIATLGHGVFTQTSDMSIRLVGERSAATGDGAGAGDSTGGLERIAVTTTLGPSLLGGSANDGGLAGIFNGLRANADSVFGIALVPTFFKMRVWNTVTNAFEYWVVSGGPSSANPSGQATLAGSLTVIAIKRPKDLVGQGAN